MWVEVGREKIYVGGAYIVPGSSARVRTADEIVRELGNDVARYTKEGQVVVAGDWNCKIGKLASVSREREFDRRNTSKKIDARGKIVIELMNASDMVILNGIRGSVAESTYEGPGGSGVDDYIAVSEGLVEKTSNIEYLSEMKDILHTDHCGVACTIRIEGNALVESKDRRERREKAGKGGYGIVG